MNKRCVRIVIVNAVRVRFFWGGLGCHLFLDVTHYYFIQTPLLFCQLLRHLNIMASSLLPLFLAYWPRLAGMITCRKNTAFWEIIRCWAGFALFLSRSDRNYGNIFGSQTPMNCPIHVINGQWCISAAKTSWRHGHLAQSSICMKKISAG